ncbi:MAG: 1-acyl-sn-glycerol-3-phosphate acyltransferase [Chloroflexi bacterium]|nr:1-acyl-sn-glycerol-3-phosphate acyltransferase [Chloroflexota bacterium]
MLGATVALLFNAVPFARTGGAPASLQYCADLIGSGWSLIVFPEGTRSTSGEIGAFKSGVGRLAVATGAPVVPVRLTGLDRILPKGRWAPRPGRARVRFGEPLVFDADTDCVPATARVEAAVRQLGREDCR